MRKPIEAEIKGLQTPRERIWRVMVKWKAPSFTIDDIHGDVRPTVKRSAVVDYVKALEAGKWVGRVSGGELIGGVQHAKVVYELLKRAHEAPRLNKAGEPVTQGLATLAMWRCMRVLGRFNAQELARASSVESCLVTTPTAKSYIKHLASVGYLVPAGTTGSWRLARNTGPHAPAITRRKGVFDRNTGTFADLQNAQEVADELE